MIKLLTGLLSSEKIVDSGINALDKIWHTEEEKAENRLEADKLRLEFVRASAPMEVSRRFIAITVTILWAVNGAMVMLMLLLDAVFKWKGIQGPDFAKVMEFGLWYVMPPFTTITGFYFWKKVKEVDLKAAQAKK